jgi:transposase-like protein
VRENGTRDTPRTLLSAAGSPRDTGLGKAVEAVFPSSVRIRCWFHRLSNIRAKLPDEAAPEVMAHLYAVRDAPTSDNCPASY